MEVVSGDNWSYKTCKAPVKMSPPTNQHPVSFTGWMSFLSPNQQCQSTAGKMRINHLRKLRPTVLVYNHGTITPRTCTVAAKRNEILTRFCQTNDTHRLCSRDAPITHWPIIGRPIIGAKQSADYRLIQKVPETG